MWTSAESLRRLRNTALLPNHTGGDVQVNFAETAAFTDAVTSFKVSQVACHQPIVHRNPYPHATWASPLTQPGSLIIRCCSLQYQSSCDHLHVDKQTKTYYFIPLVRRLHPYLSSTPSNTFNQAHIPSSSSDQPCVTAAGSNVKGAHAAGRACVMGRTVPGGVTAACQVCAAQVNCTAVEWVSSVH